MLEHVVERLRKRIITAKSSGREYNSLMWYYSTVKELRTKERRGELSATVAPGKMLMMAYNPKLSGELEYYDVFPVIFIIDTTKNGFLGLNLHYLPLTERRLLLAALLEIGRTETKDRLNISYAVIKEFSKRAEAKVCIKRYLSTNVIDMAAVPDDRWISAAFLPVENFKKRHKETVWKESKEKIAKEQNG